MPSVVGFSWFYLLPFTLHSKQAESPLAIPALAAGKMGGCRGKPGSLASDNGEDIGRSGGIVVGRGAIWPAGPRQLLTQFNYAQPGIQCNMQTRGG